MKQIRYNTFETNSSSTHSLVISTDSEFKLLKTNELYIYEDDELVDLKQAREKITKWYSNHLDEFDRCVKENDIDALSEVLNDCEIYNYEDWCDLQEDSGLETFETHFETPSGDNMVAWGRYGYNG